MAKTYVLYTWHEIYQLLRFIEIDGISINMLHDYIYLIYQNIKLYIYIICKLYIYILCVYVIVKWCTIMLVSIYLHFITIHNNSFDNQRSEINKNDIFLRFEGLLHVNLSCETYCKQYPLPWREHNKELHNPNLFPSLKRSKGNTAIIII